MNTQFNDKQMMMIMQVFTFFPQYIYSLLVEKTVHEASG